jgi:hypothetical protein
MLADYNQDRNTNMDVTEIAQKIYDYTNGYPYLVSYFCKTIDEKLWMDWTINGVDRAFNVIGNTKNPLFDNVFTCLKNDELRKYIFDILSCDWVSYNPYIPHIKYGNEQGLIRRIDDSVIISNQVFERFLGKYRNEFIRGQKEAIDLIDGYIKSGMSAEEAFKTAKRFYNLADDS